MMMDKEKIDLLIIRCLDGDINVGDSATLQSWLHESEENLLYFEEIQRIWDSCRAMGNTQDELEIALRRFKRNFRPEKSPRLARKRAISPWFYRVAVILVIGVAAFAAERWQNKGERKQKEYSAVATNKIIIPKGQKGQLILSDGTKVWLNSESTLEYPGVFGEERSVMLSGEAYFEVKSDAMHPFMVQTPKLTLKVTGTSFNIRAYESDDRIETTLVEGRLAIMNGEQQLAVLQPKESAVYSRSDNSISIKNMANVVPVQTAVKKTDVEGQMEELTPIELAGVWKDDKLIFRDEPLGSMIPKLERWFNRRIHVRDTAMLDVQYNGKFVYNETVYQVLDVICRSSADLKYKEVNHEFYILKK